MFCFVLFFSSESMVETGSLFYPVSLEEPKFSIHAETLLELRSSFSFESMVEPMICL